MALLALPNELLEAIAQNIDSAADLQALIRTNRQLYNLLETRLYTQHPSWSWDALLWSAQHGRVDTLRRAHELYGLSIEHGFGLIYEAALGCHVSVLEYLLDEGVMGVDFENCSGEFAETPLVAASRKGHCAAVELLLGHDVDTNNVSSEGYNALHYAVKGNFIDTVEILLNHGADPLTLTPQGKIPLHLACEKGLLQMAQLLLDYGGMDESSRSGSGWTSLHYAAHAEATDVVKLLLERGASVTERDNRGGTPLHWAASCGNREICRILIQYGAKASAEDESGLTPLDTAMRSGNVGLVEMFLDESDGSLEPDEGGMTPLHTAALTGDIAIVKMLIERGADVSARSMSGYTPIYMACTGGDIEVIKLLLAKGASVDARTNDGITALHKACKHGTAEVVRLLVKSGVDIHAQDNAGKTPLHLACELGCLETVKILVANGAAATLAARSTGAWPLHAALQKGGADIAMYLIEDLSVDVNVPDAAGRTPLFLAARCGSVAVIQALLDRNALPNHLDKYGAGPLIAASRSGHLKAVELLLATDTGECMRHKDNTGHTAVWWAARSGNQDLFNLYRAHAKKTGVKIWHSDRMTEYDCTNTLPAYEAGFCFCYICTLSVPWANWPRVCTTCCGGEFLICDDCYNAGFHCFDDTHRDHNDTWMHSMEYCECRQHYPHTERYVARPDLAPDLRRIFETD